MNLSPLAAPVVHEAANWSLEVRLGAGALPNVEAVQLVRALVGDTAAQKITVIEVAKLPDVLARRSSRAANTTRPRQSPRSPARNAGPRDARGGVRDARVLRQRDDVDDDASARATPPRSTPASCPPTS
ncbi:hypothetical protein ACRAWD_03350 [Caulobacter segnis]